MDIPNLLSALTAIVGGEHVQAFASPAFLTLPNGWKNPPVACLKPGSVDEVAAIVRALETEGMALLAVGGGTAWQTGYPPREDRPYVLLATRRLNQITDYQPDDMTVTCEPGVTLAQLQQHLAAHRQCLALDVPLPERATLGGIVATNRSGFLRATYGTPRDLVIGVRAIMTDGAQVKGGGKVVKNVAGYDVCKLFTGSWGTAGVITEVTFKVRPLPEAERFLRWNTPDLASAVRFGLKVHHAQVAPTFVIATNEIDANAIDKNAVDKNVMNKNEAGTHARSAVDGLSCLLVGMQGLPARMDWQIGEIARLASESGLASTPAAVETGTIDSLRDRQARLDSTTMLSGRIACLLTHTAALAATLEALPNTTLTIDCAVGTLSFAATQPGSDFVEILHTALPAEANLLWTRIDAAISDRSDLKDLNVWGHTREGTGLQRALKHALDPKGTFSPGRFVGHL